MVFPKCPHLGNETGERECPTCNGRVRLKTFACSHPATPNNVTAQDCRSCKFRPVEPSAAKRAVAGGMTIHERTEARPKVVATVAEAKPVERTVQSKRFRFPHGMGDFVQFSAVLAHLKKHKPDWRVEFAPDGELIPWKEGAKNYPQWPSTKAVRCLIEQFEIVPEKELLRYSLEVGDEAKQKAADYLARLPKKKGVVAIHYEGRSCPQKNAPVQAIAKLCTHLIRNEYVPLILDWSERPKLADGETIFCPGRGHLLWDGDDKASPEVLAALLSQVSLNVMVDSGPQKVAMAMRAPLLAIWTTSSPIHYTDDVDAANVVHLVPQDHDRHMLQSSGVDRECDGEKGMRFFRENYRHVVYSDLAKSLCEMATFMLDPEKATERPTERQAATESVPVSAIAPSSPTRTRNLLLVCGLSPGDIMTMTPALEMLHKQHPGKFVTAVETTCMPIWSQNPYVAACNEPFQRLKADYASQKAKTTHFVREYPEGVYERIEMHYHAINESGNRPVHFIEGYTEYLSDTLKVPLKMATNRPHLYLSDEEKGWMNQVWQETKSNAPFWLINAGVKSDFTAKQYPFYQEVVDLLRHRVRFVQVGKSEHIHTPLRGVINFLDKTKDDRAFFRLVYHSRGVLCGTTYLMHVAAAFNKPAVVVAGGREPRLWNSYPCQTLLSNVGALDCCRDGACWRSKVKAMPGDKANERYCDRPMPTELPAGECMTLIKPELVAAAVESYLA